MSGLALFDFDGTITRKDSLAEFIRYTKGSFQFWVGMVFLSPVIVLYKLRLLPRKQAKEFLLRYFFGGMRCIDFQLKSKEFARQQIPLILRAKAMKEIKKHQSDGDKIVVVSASPENWIREWAESHHLEYIATKLESRNGKLTGKIEGNNCQGKEKVVRVKAYLDLTHFDKIYTYGDSPGDRTMLNLGNLPHYKPFRD